MKTVMIAAAAFAALLTAPAYADVLYQSMPNLSVSSDDSFCSQCLGRPQSAGDQFTLGRGAFVQTLSFVADSSYYWPASVTIDIFKDAGGQKIGASVYAATFSPSDFLSSHETPYATDIVTVDLGGLSLSQGTYDLFLTNPVALAISGYSSPVPTGDIFVPNNTFPAPGLSYNRQDNYNIGVSISGVSVPEPATWAMLILGLAAIGSAARRRTPVVAA